MSKQLSTRKKLLVALIGAAIGTTALGPRSTWAQSVDATVRGKAAANAASSAKNVNTGALRRTPAAADGSYVLVGLPPGTYQIDAGPGTEQTVTLSVASSNTLDLVAG